MVKVSNIFIGLKKDLFGLVWKVWLYRRHSKSNQVIKITMTITTVLHSRCSLLRLIYLLHRCSIVSTKFGNNLMDPFILANDHTIVDKPCALKFEISSIHLPMTLLPNLRGKLQFPMAWDHKIWHRSRLKFKNQK